MDNYIYIHLLTIDFKHFFIRLINLSLNNKHFIAKNFIVLDEHLLK